MASEYDKIIERAKLELKSTTEKSYEHSINVWSHCVEALKCENHDDVKKLQIELASLLCDTGCDNFKKNDDKHHKARTILHKICSESDFVKNKQHFINLVVSLISIIFCTEENAKYVVRWMCIPRDCFKLEAIGDSGIKWWEEYTKNNSLCKHTENTPIVLNEHELGEACNNSKLKKCGSDQSMLDNFYSELMHIGKPENIRSQNKYILQEAEKRNKTMTNYIISYWHDFL